MTLDGVEEEDGKAEDKLPGSEVMCADAPMSMNHSDEDSVMSIMVFKACISWFWSHDEDGVDDMGGGVGACHCAPCHETPGHGTPCHVGGDGAWEWCGKEATRACGAPTKHGPRIPGLLGWYPWPGNIWMDPAIGATFGLKDDKGVAVLLLPLLPLSRLLHRLWLE